jgi:competence protein ComEA
MNVAAWFKNTLIILLLALCAAGPTWALVDINSADEKLLRTVKGIGPVKARAILAYRAKNGSFRSAADVRRVKGFGSKTLERIGHDLAIAGKPLVAPGAGPSSATAPPGQRH